MHSTVDKYFWRDGKHFVPLQTDINIKMQTRNMVSQIRPPMRSSSSPLYVRSSKNVFDYLLNILNINKGKTFYVNFLYILHIFSVFFRYDDCMDAGSFGRKNLLLYTSDRKPFWIISSSNTGIAYSTLSLRPSFSVISLICCCTTARSLPFFILI